MSAATSRTASGKAGLLIAHARWVDLHRVSSPPTLDGFPAAADGCAPAFFDDERDDALVYRCKRTEREAFRNERLTVPEHPAENDWMLPLLTRALTGCLAVLLAYAAWLKWGQ